MKNIILSAIIGAGLVASGYAIAATQNNSGLSVVDKLNSIDKIYDRDTNVICCHAWGTGGGISCLKNI